MPHTPSSLTGSLLLLYLVCLMLLGVASVAVTPSEDNTAIPPASNITDKVGAIWTLENGYVLKNGASANNISGVTLLLWYGGLIFAESSSGQFSVWTWEGLWLPASDPRIPVCPTGGSFYGINGHYDYPYTPEQTVSLLQGLGCTTYRIGCTDTTGLTQTVAMAKAFQAANLTLFVLLNFGLYSAPDVLFASEEAAYNHSFAGSVTVVKALQGLGVTTYEGGNELTRDTAIIVNSQYAGNHRIDFNNTNWPIMRGAMRGMIDAVHYVQPEARVGINFCVADVAASDMLWDGVQPDGTSGYPKVRWDVTTWHNYQAYGDLFDIGIDGARPGFSIPIYAKARYGGIPFMVTEWNSIPDGSQTVRASYITQHMTEFYQNRLVDNIESVMYYELDSGNTDSWGLVLNDGTPVDPPYSAFANVILANPDTLNGTACASGGTSSSGCERAIMRATWLELLLAYVVEMGY